MNITYNKYKRQICCFIFAQLLTRLTKKKGIRKMRTNNEKIKLDEYKDIFQMKKDAAFATVSESGEPNIVAIHSKHLISNSKVLISDQFMDKTKANILENPQGMLTILDGDKIYKMSGECDYRTSGFMYKMAVRGAKKYAKNNAKNKNIRIVCKGIILMKVQDLIIENR